MTISFIVLTGINIVIRVLWEVPKIKTAIILNWGKKSFWIFQIINLLFVSIAIILGILINHNLIIANLFANSWYFIVFVLLFFLTTAHLIIVVVFGSGLMKKITDKRKNVYTLEKYYFLYMSITNMFIYGIFWPLILQNFLGLIWSYVICFGLFLIANIAKLIKAYQAIIFISFEVTIFWLILSCLILNISILIILIALIAYLVIIALNRMPKKQSYYQYERR